VRLRYHDLLIATGASARPLNNVDPDAQKFVSTLRTIEDAENIRALAEKAHQVVVVGAGLVSLQTVRAVLRPEIKVIAVVGSDQVLSQQLDRESALLIQNRLEAAGVEILFGRSIEGVERRGERVEVRTGYGEHLEAGLVVVGKGVQPNTNLVEGTAVKKDWGILVDESMCTSVPGVYAAGDVAQGINQVSGESEVIATWFSACAQGEIAGRNMAGRPARRSGQLRENITTLMGLVVTAIGQSRPRYRQFEEISAVDFRRGVIRKFYFDGPILMGTLLIGRHPDAGVIRQCIAQRVDLSPWKARIASTPLDYGQLLQTQVFGPVGANN
jgi:NADPH-dependent 2,4-dienoyl-CoA reductase/sulfur reductase-like enzyme